MPTYKQPQQQERGDQMRTGLIGLGVLALLLVSLFFGSYVIVPAGTRAVIYSSAHGVEMQALGEGFHLKIPFFETAHYISVQVQKTEYDTAAASKDLQNVQTKVAVNFHTTPDVTPKLFQSYGADYVENVIHPAVNETVKAVMAQYPAEELITRREEVKAKIVELLGTTLAKANISVDGVYIINFEFSKEYAEAIEAKQVAQQKVLKSEQDLQRVEVEAKQKVAQAQAEAKALGLQREVITANLIQLRQVEALKLAVDKWNGEPPTTLILGDSGKTLLNLPAASKKEN